MYKCKIYMQELSESTLLELWKTVKGLTQILKKVRKGRGSFVRSLFALSPQFFQHRGSLCSQCGPDP